MKFLIIILLAVILAGCATTYHAERTDTNGNKVTLDVKSHREFTGGITITYNRETGHFELTAGDVTTGSSPLEDAAASAIISLIPTIRENE